MSDESFDESWVVVGLVVVIVVESITDVLRYNEYSSGSMVVDSDGERDPSVVLVDSSMA